MNNDTDTAAPEREPSPDVLPAGLVRPTDRRVIAGVASGLADYWNVSPILTRIGFVVLTTLGGLGFFLYIAGWLLLPNGDGTESIAEEALRKARSGESWVGIVLIGLAALITIGSIGGVDGSFAWAVAIGVVGYLLYRGDFGRGSNTTHRTASDQPLRGDRPPRPPRSPRQRREPSLLGRWTLAAGLLTVGVMALVDNAGADIAFRYYVGALLSVVAAGLLIGAFFGRARWLVLIGLLLLPAATVAQWVPGDDLFVSIQNVERIQIQPVTVADLDSQYEFAAGEVTFDLRNLGGQAFDVTIDMAAGDLVLLLPSNTDDASIEANLGVGQITVDLADGEHDLSVDVGIGEITGPGADRGGLGVEWNFGPSGLGRADVQIDLGIGQVDINR